MNSRTAFFFAASVAVLVLVFAVKVSGASHSTGRINMTATLTHLSSREVGRPGTQSNASEQAWRLNDRYGRRIGRMLMHCRWILPRARLCQVEIALPLGKIIAAGSSASPFDGEFAITGGTGRYRAAGGVMLFQAIGFKKQVLLLRIST